MIKTRMEIGMNRRLWVVIVNYRTADLVVDCLRPLAPQVDDMGGGRVVIADNASGDGSAEKIAALLEIGRPALVVFEYHTRGQTVDPGITALFERLEYDLLRIWRRWDGWKAGSGARYDNRRLRAIAGFHGSKKRWQVRQERSNLPHPVAYTSNCNSGVLSTWGLGFRPRKYVDGGRQ